MSRFKASFIHLLISAAIGALALAVMLLLWYPGAFFEAAGGSGLIVILLAVDVTIGPLITLVIFDRAKKSLKFDLTVIALLQLGALIYGMSIIFEARPAYVVFAVDRIELVRANDIDPSDQREARHAEFRELPIGRPVQVYLGSPVDPDEKLKTLSLALSGKDLHLLPKYYEPMHATYAEAIAKAAQPMAQLREFNADRAAEINERITRLGKAETAVGFLPLKARKKDLAAIIDRQSGEILDYWDFNPWKS